MSYIYIYISKKRKNIMIVAFLYYMRIQRLQNENFYHYVAYIICVQICFRFLNDLEGHNVDMVFPGYPINFNIRWICQAKTIRTHFCQNCQVAPNCTKHLHYINIKYNCSNNCKLIRGIKTSANRNPDCNFISKFIFFMQYHFV